MKELNKTGKFGTFSQLAHFVVVSRVWERLLSYKTDQRLEVSRIQGKVGSKNLFTQTILGKIFLTK